MKRGDTITTIAKKLGVGRADLAEANYLKTAARLSVGQPLLVPHEAATSMAARTERAVPVAESRPAATDAVVAAVEWTPSSDLVKTFYEVKAGDTLAAIARTFRTTVASLQTWNEIAERTQIQAGARLMIYTARADWPRAEFSAVSFQRSALSRQLSTVQLTTQGSQHHRSPTSEPRSALSRQLSALSVHVRR